MIVDSETNEDIFCFKPETTAGSSEECDVLDESELPELCEVSILDSTANKAIQRDILQLIHPILHSSLELEDQIITIRVFQLVSR